ncbi:outer membrane beta-barrel protein [Marinoscillum furvescens]|uniref:Outer membrane protein with beta-barrel domain n=1 Tax=Marinoscillum furvescens DSM 4134 TaxID=1122208 RepID=A0A3D9LGF1_MARFU|nr:outer membrane beta-barrel protein [Marinoscillum furvescens]REE05687.1 outer membrane protein with beta-barrel domain [Marinoscillum furvescens DSM 4134]
MKRIVYTILAIIGFGLISATAQRANVGVNFSGAAPLGDNADFYNAGAGADVSFDYYFNDRFDVGVEAGFEALPYDADGLDGERLTIVPVQVTAAIHKDLATWVDLYGELGAGTFTFGSSLEGVDADTYAGVSPRVGLAFELSENQWFLDTNLEYRHVFTDVEPDFNTLGLNIGLLYTIF